MSFGYLPSGVVKGYQEQIPHQHQHQLECVSLKYAECESGNDEGASA